MFSKSCKQCKRVRSYKNVWDIISFVNGPLHNNSVPLTHDHRLSRHLPVDDDETPLDTVPRNAVFAITVGDISWAVVACPGKRLVEFHLKGVDALLGSGGAGLVRTDRIKLETSNLVKDKERKGRDSF